ncbi:hypothetical protein [Streptosporangium sp. NPDC002607]
MEYPVPVPISSTFSPPEILAASSIRTTRPGIVDDDVGAPQARPRASLTITPSTCVAYVSSR